MEAWTLSNVCTRDWSRELYALTFASRLVNYTSYSHTFTIHIVSYLIIRQDRLCLSKEFTTIDSGRGLLVAVHWSLGECRGQCRFAVLWSHCIPHWGICSWSCRLSILWTSIIINKVLWLSRWFHRTKVCMISSIDCVDCVYKGQCKYYVNAYMLNWLLEYLL